MDSDLCIVLSNSLENAMEACRKVPPEQKPFVAAEARLFGGRFLIKVVNSYDGQLSKSGSTLATSKEGSGHGFGLNNIKKGGRILRRLSENQVRREHLYADGGVPGRKRCRRYIDAPGGRHTIKKSPAKCNGRGLFYTNFAILSAIFAIFVHMANIAL